MDKCYIVTEWGGEYEDYWQSVVGVCSTLHLAEILKEKIESQHFKTIKISQEKYDEMFEKFWEVFEDEDIDELEGMHKLYPEYSIEEIEEAYNRYMDYSDWGGVEIKEINFYKTENDLNYVE